MEYIALNARYVILNVVKNLMRSFTTFRMTEDVFVKCYMLRKSPCTVIAMLLVVACSGMPGKKHSEWDDLDYSKIARERYDNDYQYKPPTALGCVDDDLYNCNSVRR